MTPGSAPSGTMSRMRGRSRTTMPCGTRSSSVRRFDFRVALDADLERVESRAEVGRA